MTIDLSNPIVIGVSITLISAIVLGTFHYLRTLVLLKVTDKKLSDIIFELNTLHTNYKNEIADIKKKHSTQLEKSIQLTEKALDLYDKKMGKLIHDNRPPGLLTMADLLPDE